MDLSSFAVRRPIFTSMIFLIVILTGGISLSRLSIDLMPDISDPTLTISTTYENASPEEIEELVTRPVEEAVSAVPGVENIISSSSEGNSSVEASFKWGTDLDVASNDVRDRIDRIMSRLPDDADRPMLRKFDMASFPVIVLGVSGKLDPVQMRRFIDEQIKYRIERVPGVASIDIRGGLERQIHVNINPDKVRAMRLSINQILDHIRGGNLNLTAGEIKHGKYEITIRTPGEYRSLDEIKDTIVAEKDGIMIELGDIAEIDDSWQKVTRIVRVNGEPGVQISVQKQSGANTVEVANAVHEEIKSINALFPQIRLTPIVDSSEYIKQSIDNLTLSVIFGGALAIMILFFFLRSLYSIVVIAVAIPISIIATFSLMYFGGFTLNLMTMGGLALGVGMLVDNSIVVLENIYRFRENGFERTEAAEKGGGEVTAAVISSTLTTIVIFLPLFFVRGMAGQMFKEIAYVVSFSLFCSLLVALTLVPMLASFNVGGSAKTKSSGISNFLLSGIESSYKALLHKCLHHRILVSFLALVIFVGSLMLAPYIGTELMPESDEGEIRVDIELEPGTRIEIMDQTLKKMEKIVMKEVPELKGIVVSSSGSPWHNMGGNTGRFRISLVPSAERKRSSFDIAKILRRQFAAIPGVISRVRTSSGLFIFRRLTSGADKLQVEIRGHDINTADAIAKRVSAIMEETDGITDTDISRDSGSPEELIIIDRHKASDMKLTVKQVAEMLRTVLTGSEAGQFREEGKEFAILVKVKDAEFLDLRDILDLTIANSENEPVVLRNIVNIERRLGPMIIERKDQERIISVSGNISGRDMGSVIGDLRKELSQIPVPRGFTITFGGEYEEQIKAFRELLMAFILALILVYMVMACQFESLRDPFVVMFSVPFAALGVLLTLFLTGTTFNIQSFIGCIMLGGIVVNNAILLVDTTNLLRKDETLSMMDAVEEAGRRRLRPILMTASTTVLGLLPLALGLGESGETQAPLARVVIGGLTSSTLITLILVPVVYSFLEGIHLRKNVDPQRTTD